MLFFYALNSIVWRSNNRMKPKNNNQLCPTCKTGQDTYLLDNRNPFCPYLHCHNGKTCSAYEPLENTDGGNNNDSPNN